MNSFGHKFRVTLWGESHAEQIGVCIDGVPAGIALCKADFETDLARRRSGEKGTTPRCEKDIPNIISGIYNGVTTGSPLTITFDNTDTRPMDYNNYAHHFRPSHADAVAYDKFGGHNDPRGGGHFSGRLTVALTAAGVVAKRILGNTKFETQITEIGGCSDKSEFDKTIDAATAEMDSVGGIVECRVDGITRGVGEPFFNSVESVVSHLLFSIPAVKGVEFGSGFGSAKLRGSQNNDPIIDAQGRTATNNDGGINGGIANGNQIIVRVAIKPTPSIAREQTTYNNNTGKMEVLSIGGRHDACIALRAAVVVEAAVAIALADLSLSR